MYDLFANMHLGLVGNRKAAKQLFLSYAYGMSRKALVDAAFSLGVDRQKAKEAFRLFQRYEDWKKSVWAEFQRIGRVATVSATITDGAAGVSSRQGTALGRQPGGPRDSVPDI
jgi:DNA polymerase-1